MIICLYMIFVTINIFSIGTIGRKRSTVICSKLLPVPKKSKNCFGFSSLLYGQKRLPTPPAMITQ